MKATLKCNVPAFYQELIEISGDLQNVENFLCPSTWVNTSDLSGGTCERNRYIARSFGLLDQPDFGNGRS
jgi:hypothetical protein